MPRRFCTLLILLLLGAQAQAALHLHWRDEFSTDERTMLSQWLEEVHTGLQHYIGPLPFPVEVHVYRRDDASEPVPWAQTWRGGEGQHLLFWVDPEYPAQDFRGDWTAAHEFAHLLLPYLGREYMWFAEGFASYLQYPLLASWGALLPEEAESRREERLARAGRKLAASGQGSLAERAGALREARQYATLYWGGADYFRRVDAALMADDSSLRQVLREYLACCRLEDHDFDTLIRRLDQAGPAPVFSRILKEFR